MSASVEIKFPKQAEEAIRRLGDQGGMLRAVAKELDLQNDYTIGHIEEKRLNFPRHEPPVGEGLRHITGHLKRSLRRNTATVSRHSVSGGIGTHVKYAGVHEFGFTGTAAVPEHSRKIIVGTAVSFTAAGRKKRIKVGGTTTVRAHSRKMNLPARSPIRRGILDRSEQIGDALGRAALAFYRGKGLL